MTTTDHQTTDRGTLVGMFFLVLLVAACGGKATSQTEADPVPTTAPAAVARPTGTFDELVPVEGGARLHLECSGSGDTTVLLIAGFEAGEGQWDAVAPSIERHARVCSYARFGTGTSDPPPATQTFSTQADDLWAVLQTAGEPGPYLVVGHSFGGAEAVSFSSRFPESVSGLLLLDASPTTWPDAVCSVIDDGSAIAEEFALACAMQRDPARNAEHLDVATAFAEVADIGSLGSLPMAVVTAAEHPFPERLVDVWNEGQEHWASLSSASQLIAVDDTGHEIQVDQPGTVRTQIRQLLD